MRLTALAKVDSKGRITIPQAIREALDIEPGMLVVLLADLQRREIIVSPVVSALKNVFEVDVELYDKPGALAKLTQTLAELNADIIATRCASIARGETASCTIIVDLSKSNYGPDDIRRRLEELDVVTVVKIKAFESGW